jgi:hypothetical protein
MRVPGALHSRVATGGTDEWISPPEAYEPLAYLYRFQVDLAACSSTMARTRCFLTDSLDFPWSVLEGPGWLNPPYSDAGLFIKKASEEMGKGFTTVCLVNVATDTAAWDRYVLADDRVYVRFIPGRIWFVAGVDIYKAHPDGTRVLSVRAGERGPSPHPSAVLVFPGGRDVPPPPGGEGRFGIFRVNHYRPGRDGLEGHGNVAAGRRPRG